MLQVQVHTPGPALQAALRRAIRELQANDPVRAVTVAVPSNFAGLSLRRTLAQPSEGDPGGLLNVRFLVLPRVIELLGAPLLAARGQRPLTRAIEVELIRRALEDEAGVFSNVAQHPSTEQRLAASFRELAELSEAERASLAEAGGTAAASVRLFERVDALARDRYYHDRALADAAAEAVEVGHPALRDLGALVIVQPGPLTLAERGFIAAFAERHDVTALLARTGDASADTPVLEQWPVEGANAEDAAVGAPPPVATAIASAPDAEEEVRQAIRVAIGEMEAGTPPHRIAMLYRHASPYAALLAGQLRAAEIPWSGVQPETLAQSVAGRALLGALALPDDDYQRRAVAEWIATAPIRRGEQQGLVPAYRWDLISRSAGVVRGEDEWRSRLAQHIERLSEQLRTARDDDDSGSEWRINGIQRDLDDARAFAAFMEELFELLSPPAAGGWDNLVSWAAQLFDRYLGSEASFASRLPADLDVEHEVEAYRSVLDALHGLTALAQIRQAVDTATFQRTLLQELSRPARRVSRFGEGIFVGRLTDAAGADFDHVFILGMNEGAIPIKGSDDPLLPEHAWEAAGDEHAPTRRSRRRRIRAEERRSYLAALASAPRRTLLSSRADLRGSQAQLHSRWLLESAAALAGRSRVTNEELETLSAPWFTVVQSFDAALAGTAPAVSATEHDLRSLRAWRASGRALETHPLARSAPLLTAGWEAQRARPSSAFTRWDGNTGPLPEQIAARLAERRHSPRSLQNWAECPHRYLFGALLRISEREDPQPTLRMTALDRGSLVHSVLERFMRERTPATPETAWSDDDRRRLLEILDEECAAAERAGRTGARVVWRLDRAALEREMLLFLETDERHRRERGVVPVAYELEFGNSEEVTVVFDDGRRVRVHGRIDRVDRSPDGDRVVVLDYKSGSTWGYDRLNEDAVKAGRRLQLPVYAAGASSAYGASQVASYYWFTRPDISDDERFIGYPVDERVERRFREAFGQILRGIEGGIFVSVSGDSGRDGVFSNCRFCAYDTICSRGREREYTRKESARELQLFHALGVPGSPALRGDEDADDGEGAEG